MSSMDNDSNVPVDPRVQIELEKLNEATDNINKHEVDLDEAKKEFRELLKESVEKIKAIAKKVGNSIDAAKPYYEARLYASQLAKETQQCAMNFDKAKSVHAAAKEMVYLAEQGLGEKSTLDTACQEMLTHATTRVNESQNDCTEMRNILKISELKLEVANNRVCKLQSQLKGAIRASRPYYELRANYNALLLEQKHKVVELEAKVAESKLQYNEALSSLESISEEIHRQRKSHLGSAEDAYNRSRTSCSLPAQSHDRSKILAIHLPSKNSQSAARIDYNDEYLEFPTKMSLMASPMKQKCLEKHDCQHLLKDFACPTSSPGAESDSENCQFSSNPTIDDITNMSSEDIEQWTEIRLSNSNSSSSGYSQHNSLLLEDNAMTPQAETSDSSSDESPKLKTRIIKMEMYQQEGNGAELGRNMLGITRRAEGGITSWINNRTGANSSNSIQRSVSGPSIVTGRRQSLDIIIDTSDRVKDVFAQGIQRIGKTLERRNSESEVEKDDVIGSTDFFLFQRSYPTKDALSDEQVENLLLDQDCSDIFQNVANISK